MGIYRVTKKNRYRLTVRFQGEVLTKYFTCKKKAEEYRQEYIYGLASEYFKKHCEWPYNSVQELDKLLLFMPPRITKVYNALRSQAKEAGVYKIDRQQAEQDTGFTLPTFQRGLTDLKKMQVCELKCIDKQWFVYFPKPNKIKFRTV